MTSVAYLPDETDLMWAALADSSSENEVYQAGLEQAHSLQETVWPLLVKKWEWVS